MASFEHRKRCALLEFLLVGRLETCPLQARPRDLSSNIPAIFQLLPLFSPMHDHFCMLSLGIKETGG
jgi:hypothetical protein